jgi:hypothetical protein
MCYQQFASHSNCGAARPFSKMVSKLGKAFCFSVFSCPYRWLHSLQSNYFLANGQEIIGCSVEVYFQIIIVMFCTWHTNSIISIWVFSSNNACYRNLNMVVKRNKWKTKSFTVWLFYVLLQSIPFCPVPCVAVLRYYSTVLVKRDRQAC